MALVNCSLSYLLIVVPSVLVSVFKFYFACDFYFKYVFVNGRLSISSVLHRLVTGRIIFPTNFGLLLENIGLIGTMRVFPKYFCELIMLFSILTSFFSFFRFHFYRLLFFSQILFLMSKLILLRNFIFSLSSLFSAHLSAVKDEICTY